MSTEKDLYLCYVRGANDAFAIRSMNMANAEHSDDRIRAAYHSGYKEGYDLRKIAQAKAEVYSGHKPSRVDVMRKGKE